MTSPNELSINELNSVVGGTDKTPPKPKNPTPSAKSGAPETTKLFEIEDFSFDIEQSLGIG